MEEVDREASVAEPGVYGRSCGPLITTKAATEPEKFVILKLRSELMAAMKDEEGSRRKIMLLTFKNMY